MANINSNTVSVIDTLTNTVVETIKVGIGPSEVEYNPDNKDMYVSNRGSNTITVIDANPRTINDIIGGVILNPLDVTNSLDSANQIKEILTDDNKDNDKSSCTLLKQLANEKTLMLRNLINC